jgi:hypothetical protein
MKNGSNGLVTGTADEGVKVRAQVQDGRVKGKKEEWGNGEMTEEVVTLM